MNLLLVDPNRCLPAIPPVGLLYLAGFLRGHGYDPQIVEVGDMQEYSGLEMRLPGPVPDLIGVSIRNIDNIFMMQPEFFLDGIADCISRLREIYPGTPIVIGGAGFTIEALEIMKFMDADYGVVGEGETALLELVKCLEEGRDCSTVPGLIYRSESGYKVNPTRAQSSAILSALPFQAIELIDYGRHYEGGGMASMQTKRGCALSCDFCVYPIVEGKSYRYYSAERIVDEMEHFVDLGYQYINFCDSVFNVPKIHAENICKEIIRRGLKCQWTAYFAPTRFDEAFAELLIESGLDGVEFGLDAGCDKMLAEFAKSFRQKHIRRAAVACHNVGLDFAATIIFGNLGETMETVTETMDFLDEIEPFAVMTMQGVRVYRGTPIYGKLLDVGKVPADQTLLRPYFYRSELLPADFSDRVHDFAIAREWAFCESNMPLFPPPTDPGCEEMSMPPVRGPVWRLFRQLRAMHENTAGEIAHPLPGGW